MKFGGQSFCKCFSTDLSRVAIAYKGEDALSMVQEKKRKVDLVLTETKLADMCAFMFVQILETEFKLPVVMLCDTYHGPTILRGLLNGAVYCLSKPLHLHDVRNLWQYLLVKKREITEESSASGDIDEESEMLEAEEINDELELSEFHVTGNNSQIKRRKIEGEGPSMVLPSPVEWTAYIHSKFLSGVWDLGVYDASPSELLRRINAPGLTMEIITEKLQKYYLYLQRQQELAFKNQSIRLMGKDIKRADVPQPDDEKDIPFFHWLNRTRAYVDPFPWAMEMLMSAEALLGGPPPISFVLQAPPLVPSANAALKLVPPPWYTTVSQALPLILPPPMARPHEEDASENEG